VFNPSYEFQRYLRLGSVASTVDGHTATSSSSNGLALSDLSRELKQYFPGVKLGRGQLLASRGSRPDAKIPRMWTRLPSSEISTCRRLDGS
jgi:hypothetical protein